MAGIASMLAAFSALSPRRLRRRLKAKLFYSLFPRGVVPTEMLTLPALKYAPHQFGEANYVLPAGQDPDVEIGPGGLPVPPVSLRVGYPADAEKFVRLGQTDVDQMLAALARAGYTIESGHRILEFGCASGRMIRQLIPYADKCELWGVDINAALIHWAQRHLHPPVHFAVTTTIPHLPFEDRTFDMIFAGSVFTHIEDMNRTWLLELRRVLKPGGYLYVTIHDEYTQQLLEPDYVPREPSPSSGMTEDSSEGRKRLSKHLAENAYYQQHKDSDFGTLVIQRDTYSNVFYSRESFARLVQPMFDTLEFVPEAYGFQTAVVLRRT